MIDFTSEHIVLVGALLLFVAVLAGKAAYRFGAPALLLFLGVGMLFGLDFISYRSVEVTQFVGMVSLCIILFTGGMDTKFSQIRPIIGPGVVLATGGVVITALILGTFVWLVAPVAGTEISFTAALLLASTMSSTDSASVFSILRSKKQGLRQNLRPLLELESGSNDPMAYMLTIILIEAITLGGSLSGGTLIVQLLLQFGIGSALGVAMGYLTKWLIGFYRKLGGGSGGEDRGQATAMISILIIGSVFLTYTATTALGGNGYLAVYITGILLGNSALPHKKSITKFMDGLTWLAQIVVFLMLGLLVNPHEMLSVAAVSFLIGIFMILAGRPLSVFLCLLPFRNINLRTKTYISWVGLRGAVPIIFATYPVVADVPGASQIFNIVFFVTLLSLIIQGTTVISSARRLKLTDDTACADDDFGVELDDEHPTSLHTLTLTEKDLEKGNTLRDIALPDGGLVMMIRRDSRYIVPNGKRRLQAGDNLLIITEDPGDRNV